jgi:hypothetical protein
VSWTSRRRMVHLGLAGLGLGVVVVAGYLLGPTSNGGRQGAVRSPPRPSSVPEEAVWAGGPDGGDWILCQEVPTRGSFRCEVFGEVTGRSVARGVFVLTTGPVAASFYDGVRIYLKDGRTLEPDGWVEYPAARKRQKYARGKEVSEEESIP